MYDICYPLNSLVLFKLKEMAPHHRLGTQPEQPNQGFLDAMYAAFQGMTTRAQNEQPVEDRKQGYFQEFRRAPIPSFNSEGGP